MSYTRRLTTSLGPRQACIHSGRDSVTLRPAADARKAEVRVFVTSGTHLKTQSSADISRSENTKVDVPPMDE